MHIERNLSLFVCVAFVLNLAAPCVTFSQTTPFLPYPSPKELAIQAELNRWELMSNYAQGNIITKVNNAAQEVPEENQAIFTPENHALPKQENPQRDEIIELCLEYLFAMRGDQIFEVIDSQGRKISKLHYPHRGEMIFLSAEMHVLPGLSIGGKFASSHLKRTTTTDTDWLPAVDPEIWWESNSNCSAELEYYDINFFLRVLDTKRDKESRLKWDELFDFLLVKKLTFDIVVGYQHEKARYGMTDLIDTIEWWAPTSNPVSGLNSFYKVQYQGPRLGFRAQASDEKWSTKIDFAYAWLTTKGYGWWNLRDYTFEQAGTKGVGVDFSAELTYKFTRRLSAGLGYRLLVFKQEKMKESGNQPGLIYDDLDIIRNVESSISGPYTVVRFIW